MQSKIYFGNLSAVLHYSFFCYCSKVKPIRTIHAIEIVVGYLQLSILQDFADVTVKEK